MSGRIRTVKPEWLEDEALAMASSDARVLSIALMLMADDYGNGRANPVMLSGRVFPAKDRLTTLDDALDELANIRFVTLYEVNGQSYFSIRNWSKHQRVDRPGRPQVPSPSSENAKEKTTTTNIPVMLAKDRDDDTNIPASRGRGRGPFTGPDPDPDQSRIACPVPIEIPDDSLALLEVSPGVPRWAAVQMAHEYALGMASNPTDRRPRIAWVKCALKAICGRWSDPAKRPKKPTDTEHSEAELKARSARREAINAAETARRRAEIGGSPADPETLNAALEAAVGAPAL